MRSEPAVDNLVYDVWETVVHRWIPARLSTTGALDVPRAVDEPTHPVDDDGPPEQG